MLEITSITKYLNRKIHLWPPCSPIDVIPVNSRWKHFVVFLHKEALPSSNGYYTEDVKKH